MEGLIGVDNGGSAHGSCAKGLILADPFQGVLVPAQHTNQD